jgi:hypothetical protein
VLDLAASLFEQRFRVRTGEVGRVEQSEEPRQRRPELVRNSRCEADPELVECVVSDD